MNFDTMVIGNAGAFDIGSFRGGCHRVPSAQGEHKGKLVCNLPAVQLLLPADLGLLDRFLRRNPDSHPVDLDVCCCTLSTLIRFADGRVTESSDLDEACVMSKGSCFSCVLIQSLSGIPIVRVMFVFLLLFSVNGLCIGFAFFLSV